jgi:1,4-alpha-glucan branching enzyme
LIETNAGKPDEFVSRLSPWIRRAEQDLEKSVLFEGVFWNPSEVYVFQHPKPNRPRAPKIYEAHIGVSSAEPRMGRYDEFMENVLPRIKRLGYNGELGVQILLLQVRHL